MKKEIIVAIDDSGHSRQAVRYASAMSGVIKELSYILFHVQPPISQYVIEEADRDPVAKAKLKKIQRKNTENSEILLNRFKKQMIDAGIKDTRVKTVSRPNLSGVAKDILGYSLVGQIDAAVVGRRGVTKVQEIIMGSVTRQLLEHTELTPVWVVDDEVTSDKILLAVDGSESSLRAVDHLGFMLKDNADAVITILHVKPRFRDFLPIDFESPDTELGELLTRGEKHRIENFYGHALKKFNASGIGKNQLHIKDVECNVNVGKTIVNEIKKGGYGTVVIGRSGTNNSFFFGSVSRHVLEKASRCAIWLVP